MPASAIGRCWCLLLHQTELHPIQNTLTHHLRLIFDLERDLGLPVRLPRAEQRLVAPAVAPRHAHRRVRALGACQGEEAAAARELPNRS